MTEHLTNTIEHLQRPRQDSLSKFAHDIKPGGVVDMLESRAILHRGHDKPEEWK